MVSAEKERATYADLEQVPENKVGEIINGELFVSPRPAFKHADAAGRIFLKLGTAFDDPEGSEPTWIILFEPELHLDGDAFIPDLAGWRRDRMPELPDVVASDVVPNWVCEVLSPSTLRHDRMLKLPRYAQLGVDHAWLVHPRDRTIEVYLRKGSTWEPVGVWGENHPNASDARIPPFDSVPFDTNRWWR